MPYCTAKFKRIGEPDRHRHAGRRDELEHRPPSWHDPVFVTTQNGRPRPAGSAWSPPTSNVTPPSRSGSMSGVSDEPLAAMLTVLGLLAIDTMQTVKHAGGRLPDGLATSLIELGQVGGIGEAVEIHRQIDAFIDGTLLQHPGDQFDMAAAVHHAAALNAVAGMEWSGISAGQLAARMRVLATLNT